MAKPALPDFHEMIMAPGRVLSKTDVDLWYATLPICPYDGEPIVDHKRAWIAPDGRLFHNSDEADEFEQMAELECMIEVED
jgi:hypothetical protein